MDIATIIIALTCAVLLALGAGVWAYFDCASNKIPMSSRREWRSGDPLAAALTFILPTLFLSYLGFILAAASYYSLKVAHKAKLAKNQFLDRFPMQAQASSSADELLKYKHLLDKGAISQTEFDNAKNRVLGGPAKRTPWKCPKCSEMNTAAATRCYLCGQAVPTKAA